MIGPITSVGTTATMGAGSVLDDGKAILVGNGSRTRMVPDEWPSDHWPQTVRFGVGGLEDETDMLNTGTEVQKKHCS